MLSTVIVSLLVALAVSYLVLDFPRVSLSISNEICNLRLSSRVNVPPLITL